MNTHASIAYALNDKKRESARTEKKAIEGLAWFISTAMFDERYPVIRTFEGTVQAFFNHARSMTTIADAYVRTIEFAVKLLTRYYFGEFDVDLGHFEEHSIRVIDMMEFAQRVTRRNQ